MNFTHQITFVSDEKFYTFWFGFGVYKTFNGEPVLKKQVAL